MIASSLLHCNGTSYNVFMYYSTYMDAYIICTYVGIDVYYTYCILYRHLIRQQESNENKCYHWYACVIHITQYTCV